LGSVIFNAHIDEFWNIKNGLSVDTISISVQSGSSMPGGCNALSKSRATARVVLLHQVLREYMAVIWSRAMAIMHHE
jgi:hypothetical protein